MGEPKKKPAKKAPAPAKPEAPPTSEAALKAVQGEIEALDAGTLATINLDIPQAVSVALGVIPHLAEFRPQIVKSLPDHPIETFDKLHTYALAAYHAHILWLPPETSENRVRTLLDEAAPLRANLLSDAEALARRGRLDAETVAQIRADQGNVDTANDLVALSALFMTKWEGIENNTAATIEEVKRAGELGPLLLAALGMREHGIPLGPDVAADQRRRTYTLFVNAYDETRRAITYLRWHDGDGDQIVPSLYKGRGGRAKEETQTSSPGGEQAAGGQGSKVGG